MVQIVNDISCLGYRGFRSPERLELAVPNGEFGSGLTAIIGPNGGGKSTIVEAFRKLTSQDTSFTEGRRNRLAGDRVSIRVTVEGQSGELRTTPAGGSETEWVSDDGIPRPKVFFVPSRRVFRPFFSRGGWERATYTQNVGDFQFRGQSIDQFSYRLFHAFENRDKFDPIFERVYGTNLEWTIDQNDAGQYYVKVNKSGPLTHNSDGLGEGVVSLLFLVDALFESTNEEILVIDEPELSLHPQLQRRLLAEMAELAKDRQIIYATHSPEMISVQAIVNGMRVARAVDEGEAGCKIYALDEACRDTFRSLENDLFNPHAFGYDSKACLFAEDHLVVAEGQEDVVFFRRMLEDLQCPYDIPFWGYGAGGSGKIRKISEILKSLGFKRVGAVFDGDKVDDAEQFKQEFPDYKCCTLPADDIRDKQDASGVVVKIGVYDLNKQLKPEYGDPCRDILDELHDYLSNG